MGSRICPRCGDRLDPEEKCRCGMTKRQDQKESVTISADKPDGVVFYQQDGMMFAKVR